MELKDKVSEHFTYGEVIKSNTAIRLGMDNSLPDELLENVERLAKNILEPIRIHFNKPVIITSWYRCQALNAMISKNPNSQHTKGEAADFTVPGLSNLEIAEYIRDNLDFDQLILEYSWVHCSYVANGRKGVLRTINGIDFEKGLA